ncbi:MAG: DUF3987 domain-containing protein [Deltaproteobacteria bacterium]|nr:DUF3987 domain-containing protein [Deltaproteobacteria bacterium]
MALVNAGASESKIIKLFEGNPQGIGEKYFEKKAGRVKWLEGEIARCRRFSNRPSVEWPEPEPIQETLPLVLPLQDEMIPRPFLPMVKDEAHRMSVPPDYITAPLIVTCGALIGTGCRIRPKRKDDWPVVPNLWGGIIGPPSRLKTPAMDVVVKKLLGRLEYDAAQEHEAEMETWADDKRRAELSKTVLEQEYKAALKGERSGNSKGRLSDDILVELKELEETTQELVEDRYKTNDATIEKLVELLKQNPRGILYYRDELVGLFKRMENPGP